MNDDVKKSDDQNPYIDTTQDEKELDGPKGPEPVRYSKKESGEGDWEVAGRCTDF